MRLAKNLVKKLIIFVMSQLHKLVNYLIIYYIFQKCVIILTDPIMLVRWISFSSSVVDGVEFDVVVGVVTFLTLVSTALEFPWILRNDPWRRFPWFLWDKGRSNSRWTLKRSFALDSATATATARCTSATAALFTSNTASSKNFNKINLRLESL